MRFRKNTWDSTIVKKIAKIHEAKGKQELYLEQNTKELSRLIEIAKIRSTESSNAIEGIRTTDSRLKKIISEKITPKNRNEREIAGYRDALNIINENFNYIPITPNYILYLHKIMCGKIEKYQGGKFKNVQNYITAINEKGKSYTLFKPVSPFETPQAIKKICDEFNKAVDSQEIDPLLLIPLFIHDFLCIHPFMDGNGRMSRLLTTLLLYRSGYHVVKYISLESKISQQKDLYYESLYKSQIGWYEEKDNPIPFVNYLLNIIEMAYDDFENITIISKKTSAYDAVRNVLNTKIGKISKSNIIELCPLLSSSSIEKVLAKMVKEGKLEKTGLGKNTSYIIMHKFIVNISNYQYKSGVLFISENENKKYKSFLDKLNSSYEVKKFNGSDSYNFDDVKSFLHKVKESFENEFQNLVSYDYNYLKSEFRIIVPWTIFKNSINELEIDFEFQGVCWTDENIITNQ